MEGKAQINGGKLPALEFLVLSLPLAFFETELGDVMNLSLSCLSFIFKRCIQSETGCVEEWGVVSEIIPRGEIQNFWRFGLPITRLSAERTDLKLGTFGGGRSKETITSIGGKERSGQQVCVISSYGVKGEERWASGLLVHQWGSVPEQERGRGLFQE
ncbi:hypothetical protein KI387_037436 [Taxus chinensis]|uniref:Uncharacterized protein n=1 Tax=Taxus chinensis TaxID=29808 RepID=A0AA38FSA0_TAXCH|nr:hypothetical protein KI387_037436 [Taxus chinensis]